MGVVAKLKDSRVGPDGLEEMKTGSTLLQPSLEKYEC